MFGFRSAKLCSKELKAKLGQDVTLAGWVSFVRKTREVTFIGLRDSTENNHNNLVQIVVPNAQVNGIKLEDVISVSGKLEPRNDIGSQFEIKSQQLKVENRCMHPLPLDTKQQSTVQTPQQRDASLTYRYLDLRIRPHLSRNLQVRGAAALAMRNYLSNEADFLEVETPTLFKSTPEGAREFLVPVQSETEPKFYALVQSPQQYKQMLMVGGVDRYFQFARCYRDEGGRADRQPEFTQLDMELAFVTECDHVQLPVERVVCAGWRAAYAKCPDLVPLPPAENKRFFQMPFSQAIAEYGSDKPNLSFAMRIEQGMVTAPGLAAALAKKERSDLIRQITVACPAIKVSDIKFEQNGNVVVVGAGSNTLQLGRARLLLHEWMLKKQVAVPAGVLPKHEPFWVVNFSLFDREDGVVSSTHHPFTAPHPEDLHKLEQALDLIASNGSEEDGVARGKQQLLELRALHYDLVCDGMELGGGSLRIHNSALQHCVLRDALGISESDCRTQFGHLLDALSLGAPPHGGFALGFDRFISLLCQSSSLSDTLAFPKSSTGTDPLTGAPCPLTDTQQDVLQRFALQSSKKQ